jgi:hypothetical protein
LWNCIHFGGFIEHEDILRKIRIRPLPVLLYFNHAVADDVRFSFGNSTHRDLPHSMRRREMICRRKFLSVFS